MKGLYRANYVADKTPPANVTKSNAITISDTDLKYGNAHHLPFRSSSLPHVARLIVGLSHRPRGISAFGIRRAQRPSFGPLIRYSCFGSLPSTTAYPVVWMSPASPRPTSRLPISARRPLFTPTTVRDTV